MCALFRNALDLKAPANGWGKAPPGINDTNTAVDIERIRLYRNKISHTTSYEMDTEHFNDLVLDLLRVDYEHKRTNTTV